VALWFWVKVIVNKLMCSTWYACDMCVCISVCLQRRHSSEHDNKVHIKLWVQLWESVSSIASLWTAGQVGYSSGLSSASV